MRFVPVQSSAMIDETFLCQHLIERFFAISRSMQMMMPEFLYQTLHEATCWQRFYTNMVFGPRKKKTIYRKIMKTLNSDCEGSEVERDESVAK